MARTSLLIVPLASLAFLLAGTPASHARGDGCRPKGSETLAKNTRARVFKYQGRFYGCLLKRNQRYRLWARRYTVELEHIQLAGRYAGYVTYADRVPRYGKCDQYMVGARSTNLRDGSRGKRIHSLGCGDITAYWATDLALARNGSFGIIRMHRDYEDEDNYYEVIKADGPKEVVLDTQPIYLYDDEDDQYYSNPDGIVPDSLEARSGRLQWERASGEQAAELR